MTQAPHIYPLTWGVAVGDIFSFRPDNKCKNKFLIHRVDMNSGKVLYEVLQKKDNFKSKGISNCRGWILWEDTIMARPAGNGLDWPPTKLDDLFPKNIVVDTID